MEIKFEQTFIQKIFSLISMIISIAAACFIALIIGGTIYVIWPDSPDIVAYIIFGVLALIIVVFVFVVIKEVTSKFYVTINGYKVFIYDTDKRQYEFDLRSTSVGYTIKTGGSGFSATLTFVTADGKKEEIDFTRLGKSKVESLLEELKIEEQVIKL